MKDQDDYLTLEQVAEKLQLSKITIYRMVNSKQLPAVKIGRSWRISSKKLAKLFETSK